MEPESSSLLSQKPAIGILISTSLIKFTFLCSLTQRSIINFNTEAVFYRLKSFIVLIYNGMNFNILIDYKFY
jgi:hypothetical protein